MPQVALWGKGILCLLVAIFATLNLFPSVVSFLSVLYPFLRVVADLRINKFYTEKVSLTVCYDISVTAMKAWFSNSDIATAKLYWLPSSGSLDETSINSVSMRGIAIQSDGGFITISGLDNNETVSFYAIDGKNLGFSTAIKGTTFFTAKSGSVVIAKFGNESIKILVK